MASKFKKGNKGTSEEQPQEKQVPQAPRKISPPPSHPYYDVWKKVIESIPSLPDYFETETTISGLRATDIFTLNATLGATIEDQVVATLNKMRPVWDVNEKYNLFGFIRQPQTFPDVLFAKRNANNVGLDRISFGIELKGWYVLAKEGEPSFRYQVTPSVCTELDLIVIVPWFLSNVISGTPKILTPYIESAHYAAMYRNYHWQHIRQTTASIVIKSPTNVRPYPTKSDKIADKPEADSGGNFGRFARTGLMDKYMTSIDEEPIAGIAIKYWRQFFKMFQQNDDPSKLAAALKNMENQMQNEINKKISEPTNFGILVIDAIKKEFDIN